MANALQLQTAKSLNAYQNAATARWFSEQAWLTPVEEAALAATRDHWKGGDVLDIGFGGGRTSNFLAPEAGSYVGADFSSVMVEAARLRHPGLDLRVGDCRNLEFADGRFDFALFSYNGIDSLGDADRAEALKEVARVLKPGGVFLFSSHNLDFVGFGHIWKDMFSLEGARTPVALAKAVVRIGVRLVNYLSNLSCSVRTERYAVASDAGNRFASPHYYVGAAEMKRQIEAAGLILAAVFDEKGQMVEPTIERESALLYYQARKPA